MAGEPYKERVPYNYAVTYGWPGLPTITKLVDLEREVTELLPPSLGASHLGHITALPADTPR